MTLSFFLQNVNTRWQKYVKHTDNHWSKSSADPFKKGCCQLQAKVCAQITGYLLVQACPGKSVVRWTDRPAMTIAVDLGLKATKQTNKTGLNLNKWSGVFKRNQSFIFPACSSRLLCNGWTLTRMSLVYLFMFNEQHTCSLTCKLRW